MPPIIIIGTGIFQFALLINIAKIPSKTDQVTIKIRRKVIKPARWDGSLPGKAFRLSKLIIACFKGRYKALETTKETIRLTKITIVDIKPPCNPERKEEISITAIMKLSKTPKF
ncbi:MAG: hypothetical protein QXU76_03970, partial [Candidatus Bilamarchaeaceae archaeon]